MKKRQIVTLACVFLVVGSFVSASSSVAKSTKTPVDFWEVSCEVDPGISWVSDDGILHGRGRVSEAVFYAYDEDLGEGVLVGTDTVISNANLDLATGSGRVFGSFTLIYLPSDPSDEGTFDGKFNGSLTDFVLFTGRAVGHGTGPLTGQRMKLFFETIPPPTWLQEALDEDPPSCPFPGIYHDTGFIHAPRGD